MIVTVSINVSPEARGGELGDTLVQTVRQGTAINPQPGVDVNSLEAGIDEIQRTVDRLAAGAVIETNDRLREWLTAQQHQQQPD